MRSKNNRKPKKLKKNYTKIKHELTEDDIHIIQQKKYWYHHHHHQRNIILNSIVNAIHIITTTTKTRNLNL